MTTPAWTPQRRAIVKRMQVQETDAASHGLRRFRHLAQDRADALAAALARIEELEAENAEHLAGIEQLSNQLSGVTDLFGEAEATISRLSKDAEK